MVTDPLPQGKGGEQMVAEGLRHRRPDATPAACENRREGAGYFAADIDSTWIVMVLASSVPVTRTFCPANLSGVF